MGISANAKLENIKVSVEKYIYDNISNVSIDFEGLYFESGATDVKSWIQPRLLGFADPSWKPKSATSRRGNTASCMLNFNCFVKRGWTSATSRHYELRDTVADVFYSGASIPLRDYVGGTTRPWIGLIKIEDIITDTAIPNNDHFHYNYTISLQWIREWSD